MRVWYVPLFLDGFWSRPGYTLEHRVSWRLAPVWGLFTIVKVTRDR